MSLPAWSLFCALSLITAFSPGPAVLLAVSNAATLGMRRALISSTGNAVGVVLVSATAMLGLDALLKASAWLFGALKLAGAVYLIYLGIRQWRSRIGVFDAVSNTVRTEQPVARLFLQGLLVATTNPKSILFFTALLPQFMSSEVPVMRQFLMLTLTFATCTVVSHLCYVGLVRGMGRWFASSARSRLFNRLCGAMFVVLGVGMLRLRNNHAA